MTMQLKKTDAEIAFAEAFEAVSGSLPGAGLADLRSGAMARFAETGLPSRRSEAYRYTDLKTRLTSVPQPSPEDSDPLSDEDAMRAKGPFAGIDAHFMMFLNGRYRLDTLDGGMGFNPLSLVLQGPDGWAHERISGLGDVQGDIDDDTVVQLNTGLMADGFVLDVSEPASKPFFVVHATRGASGLQVTRNVVRVADGLEAVLIEHAMSLDETGQQSNALTQVELGEAAVLHHIRVQDQNRATAHLDTVVVSNAKQSQYKGFCLTTGGSITRNSVFQKFVGTGALFDYSGAYLGRGDQHSDTTMVIDHAVPEGTSRELFKTVLADDARAVFQGKVIVQPHAQQTDGKQMSQALLLSETAEFDAKPELEIFADDVVCGHGATSGQIDDDLLFYLKARGIPDAQARGLLVQAFIGEALETIDHEGAREALSDVARTWFEQAAAGDRD